MSMKECRFNCDGTSVFNDNNQSQGNSKLIIIETHKHWSSESGA